MNQIPFYLHAPPLPALWAPVIKGIFTGLRSCEPARCQGPLALSASVESADARPALRLRDDTLG